MIGEVAVSRFGDVAVLQENVGPRLSTMPAHRDKRYVEEEDVLAAHAELELAQRLDVRHGLDVAHLMARGSPRPVRSQAGLTPGLVR